MINNNLNIGLLLEDNPRPISVDISLSDIVYYDS